MDYPKTWYDAAPVARKRSPHLGDIYLLIIPEMGNKVRPCVVFNIRGDNVQLIPLSSHANYKKTSTLIQSSYAAVNQITTINKSKFWSTDFVNKCSAEEFTSLRDEVASAFRMLNYELIR